LILADLDPRDRRVAVQKLGLHPHDRG
jgi:hypothetical protein